MAYLTHTGYAAPQNKPSFISRITTALELHKQRKVLSGLTNEQLTDVGLTRRDVEIENAKSLWTTYND